MNTDRLILSIWITIASTVLGVILVLCQFEMIGGLLMLGGVMQFLWQIPLCPSATVPSSLKPEITHVHNHQHFHMAPVTQVLPQYDLVTFGRELDIRAGVFRDVVQFGRRIDKLEGCR